MAKVAILILNYNGEHHLKRFLPSVINNSPGCDIIIGDNNSTDGSIEFLENSFSDIRIIKLAKNYGYAEGYNRLIQQVDNEYIALVNSDVEPTPNWTQSLISLLDSDIKIACVQPKILFLNEPNKFEHAGAAGGFIDQYGYPFCRGRVFNTIEEDIGQYNDTLEVFWASGACCMIRKSVYEELEGFDKDFFAHMEEIDLNWRMHKIGYKIMFSNNSTVFHLGGGTLSYQHPRKTYLNFRNSWVMLIKNLSDKSPLKILIIRWCLDLASMLFYIFQLQFSQAFAVAQAHMYVALKFKKIRKKRMVVNKLGNLKSNKSPIKFSIVWQYFINKKRCFSDLIPN